MPTASEQRRNEKLFRPKKSEIHVSPLPQNDRFSTYLLREEFNKANFSREELNNEKVLAKKTDGKKGIQAIRASEKRFE